MIKTKQTSIKLHDYNGDLDERWYISYTYFSKKDNKNRRVKIYLGLNLKKTAPERYEESKMITGFIQAQIREGWNPDVQNLENFVSQKDNPDYSESISFNKALEFALTKGSWSTKTKQGYSLTVDYVKKAAIALGMANKAVKNVKRRDIKLLMDWVKEERSWSNNSYNKNLGYLQAVISKLLEFEFIEMNPCAHIKPLPVVDGEKFKAFTSEEKEAIQNHLILKHYRFYIYTMVIYYTGIRPKEVLALRVKDVDLAKREIIIVPDLEEENSKTKKIRYVPMVEHLFLFFKQMNLERENKDLYIFGSPCLDPLRKKSNALDPEFFSPSPFKAKRDTATRLWSKLVMSPKDKGGLGINKKMYWMKHTGADDYILAGVNTEALKMMYGHSSVLMTQRYISKLKDVYKNDIINHAPKF